MIGDGEQPRDLAVLVVPGWAALEATGDLFQPYRLVDTDGAVVAPVAAYFSRVDGVRATGGHATLVWDGFVAVFRRFGRPPLVGTSMMPPLSSSTTRDILSLRLVDGLPPVSKPVVRFTCEYCRSMI